MKYTLLAVAMAACTTAAVRVAVVQHTIVQGPNPAGTMQANLDVFAMDVATAANANAALVVFPEFGLFETDFNKHCMGPQASNGYCEEYAGVGQTPCDLNGSIVLRRLSCLARAHAIALSVNLCETVTSKGNFNTQIVVDHLGQVAAKYHKTHPYFGQCFETPQTMEVVSFNLSSSGPTVGIFTCFDIMFLQPVAALLARGIRVFSYSASIPGVGAAAEQLFSEEHDAVIMASNLAPNQSGIYAAGSRLSPKNGARGERVIWTDI